MKNRLPPINPALGDTILEAIECLTGKKADIILMAFPHGVDNPQPEFITSFQPDIMESVIKQIAAQMTEKFVATREVDRRN